MTPVRQHSRPYPCLALLALFVLARPASLRAQHTNGPAAELNLPDAPGVLLFQTTQAAERSAVLTGTVVDIAGALVPGASVTLKSQQMPPHKTVTDAAGQFTFANLAAGTYSFSVTEPGLQPFQSQPFELLSGQHLELPPTQLRIADANTTVSVGANSAEVAEEELHLETKQRVLGIFPNFYTSYIWNAAPLNNRQKLKLTYKVLADPVSLFGFAVTAEVETNADTFPRWGRDAPSYGKRFGAAFGDALFSRGFDSAVFPILFHQDPRYFYMGPAQPVKKRLLHALSNGLIARGDNGQLQPNYSHLVGNAAAGALSSVYHPADTGAGTLALDNTLLRIGGDAVQALVREFVVDHIHHNKQPYANGEPAENKEWR